MGPSRLAGVMAGGVIALAVAVIDTSVWAVASAVAQTAPRGGAGAATTPSPASGAKRPGGEANAIRRATPGNLVGHGGPIKAITIDPRAGLALTGSFDYALMVWDVADDTPRRLARLEDHGGAVNVAAFVPAAAGQDKPVRALAAGDDGPLALWSIATGRLVHRFAGHTAKVVGLAVSDDGRWAATASWDRTARLWDLDALKAGPVLAGHSGPVNAVAFSADGRDVFTGAADGLVRRFRTDDGTLVRPIYRHGWGINVLARLAGGNRLAFGSLNGDAGVLDPATGAPVLTLPPGNRPILALSSVAQPGLIATGGGDGVIRVFRAADAALIEAYQNPYGPVWALAFRPGGASLYYGGLDDFATLWRVTPRAPFEPVDTPFPRRFQRSGNPDDPVALGEIQFARKCSVCHTVEPDGRNRAGPTLHGIFGRRIASLPGYPFSEPLKHLDIVWTEDAVSKLFELGPEVFTPGSKMPLQKMTDTRQRAALIAYLKVATNPKPRGVDGGGPAGQGSENQGVPR